MKAEEQLKLQKKMIDYMDLLFASAMKLTGGDSYHGGSHHSAVMDAQDLVQDTMVKVFTSKTITEVDNLGVSWLTTVLTNVFIDKMRARREYATEFVGTEQVHMVRRRSMESLIFAEMWNNELREAIGEENMEILMMRYVDGAGNVDVAREFGCSLPMAKWKVKQAKDLAREHLVATQ